MLSEMFNEMFSSLTVALFLEKNNCLFLQENCTNCSHFEDALKVLCNDNCWIVLMMSAGHFAAGVYHKFVSLLCLGFTQCAFCRNI